MSRKLLLAAVLAAAFMLPTAARAQQQDAWEQQVRTLITQAGNKLAEHGYQMTHRAMTGALNQADSTMLDVRLDGGTTYQVVGVCDTDCSDMDIVVLDASGRVVGSDTEADDVPIVAVAPPAAGTYRLKVLMATCSSQPCRFGVGVFGK